MNNWKNNLIIIMALAIFAVSAAGSEIAVEPINVGVPDQIDMTNFTKIEISPQYGNFRLQPGESKEMTVTVRNKENKTVSVKPFTVLAPYGSYTAYPEWVTIAPETAKIPAGGSQKFTVKVTVPADASIGGSGLQIAFTNETMPAPYPMPYPNYIHVFQLSLDIWTMPKIQIMNQYINDMLEAGKEYDYEVKLKNTGKEAIKIDPKMSSDNAFYGGPYGPMTAAFTDDAITITSPSSVPAGATETVKIHVKVPIDSKGQYNGGINLNIDDPSIRDYEGRVQLYFNVWTQPTEPFVKNFNMKEAAPLTIEISSSFGYGYPYGMPNANNKKEPSFETTIEGPSGKVDSIVTKTMIKGGVNLGGQLPPWELDSKGIYQENGVQLVETYKVSGTKGAWKLKVLPKNTESFEYSITIGE